MSVKYPNYVNLTSSSEEQPNKRTPSPPPRKKSLSPPQAPSKSISSKRTHYTSSSSPSESLTPTHVEPPPKLYFIIPIKQEPQELPPLQMSPNDPYAQTMDNYPPGPSNPSLPPRVSQPPPDFLNPPPGFEPLPSTQPLFVNINNNTPLLHNNAPPLENIHHPPPNLASSLAFLQRVFASLHGVFSMTDLGSLNYFLGISAQRSSTRLFLLQPIYAKEILKRTHMKNCNSCRTPVDTESKLGADSDLVTDPTLYQSLAGAIQYLTFIMH
nr:ribonuclease H-like domain-containing protein [Tanacetum cinerariifolium]